MEKHYKEYHAKYYEDHKDTYNQKARQKYRDSLMLTCDCGVVIKLCYNEKHQKTKKHKNYIKKKCECNIR